MPLLARRAASATERTLVYFRMNMYIRPPMRLCFSTTHQSISGRCWTRVYFRDGSIASFWTSADDFRSYPGNGHRQRRSACLKSAISRRAILFDHAKSSLTAKGNGLLRRGPFQEDTRLLTRRHNRATQIRLRFISISRSRRKLRPRTVRRF
jgi:hypothetical protein